MSNQTNNLLNRNRIPFFICSLLFFSYYLTMYLVPPPPNETNLLQKWILDWKLYLQIADEILIFAVLALIPSIYQLANPWRKEESTTALFASGLVFFLVVPMFVLVDLLIGRLVYPVNSYPLSEDTIVFLLSMQVGTMHMISLVLALAILLYSISYRNKNKNGSLILVFGVLTFGFQMIASYSWLISPGVLLFCQLSFPIWILFVGISFVKVDSINL
ncbi:hypothetical protein [Leptospira bandrabouensis]|uniref:hypothetical protein n=1 Tax=Leptospira bandrabouensis TaxID=2484903 RepID=UPI001EEA58FC|nr:hypothetical protein [Leptospira bandrabouensis]MCG6152223.1 hypothetical protein [Leptospira bandrabouensis]